MLRDPSGYYSRLGVARHATAAEIKAAYRQRSKQLHPDVNSSPGAAEQFRELNEAYYVLGDEERRSAYHRHADEEAQMREEKRIEPLRCERCGQVAAQPRYVAYRHVVSVVLVTTRIPVQGLFCSSCGRSAALRASLISSVAGWWGVPWGPIYTFWEICRNGFGGSRETASEEGLMMHNALAFALNGNERLAFGLARNLQESPNAQTSGWAVKFIDALRQSGCEEPPVRLKNPWRLRVQDVAAHAGLLLTVPLAAFLLVYQAGTSSAAPADAAPTMPIEYTEPVAVPEPPAEPPRPAERVRTCAQVPGNGQVLRGYARNSARRNFVRVTNGGSDAAILKVRNARTGRVAVTMYVEPFSTAEFRKLPDGEYRMQFATGGDLKVNCRSFVDPRSVEEYPGTQSLVAVPEADGIRTAGLALTLTPVAGGNVRTEELDRAAFDAD